MNVKVIDKDVLDTLKICHQVIDLGMSYQQVADNMHISAPTVGRRLEKAKKVRWVKEQISFDTAERKIFANTHIHINSRLPLEVVFHQMVEIIIRPFPRINSFAVPSSLAIQE